MVSATSRRGTGLTSSSQWISVAPLSSVAAWYLDSLDTVKRLGNMPENWDGFGSPSISVRATIATNYVLSLISFLRMSAPHIAPVPGGGIQLEWDADDRSLEIEIDEAGECEYLVSRAEEIYVAPLSAPEQMLPVLLKWLKTGNAE